jgi:hypothetical protein
VKNPDHTVRNFAFLVGVAVVGGLIIAAVTRQSGSVPDGPTTTSTSTHGTPATVSTTTSIATTTVPGPALSPTQVDAALLPREGYGKYIAGELTDWGEVRSTGLIDPNSPQVCGQALDTPNLSYGTARTVEIYRNGFWGRGGTAAMTFNGGGASAWFGRLRVVASGCAGASVSDAATLVGTDGQISVHVPGHSVSQWSDDDAMDLVVFVKHGTVWMAAFETPWPEQQPAAARSLAADLLAAVPA